jgi:glycosyltransferase involved in cell wall biosynthesis
LLFIAGTALTQARSHRAQHIARYLIERGMRVDVVGAVNFHGTLVERPDTGDGAQGAGRGFVRVRGEGQARRITLRKLPKLGGFVQSLWMYILLLRHLERRYEVGIIGHPDHALLAFLLKRTGRIRRLVYDDWDYFPPAAFSTREARTLALYEKWLVKEADAVASVSPRLVELRREQGARRTLLVPNGVNMRLFERTVREGTEGGPSPEEPPTTLFYMGNLGRLWGVDIAIDAMPLIRQQVSDVRLLITGYGLEEAQLHEQVHRLGLDDVVRFLGNLTYQDLLARLRTASVGLAPYRRDTFSQYSAPQKIVEYMAAGLPVVATRQGYAEYILEQSLAGEAVEPTPQALAAGVARLLRDPTHYAVCARNASIFAQRYDWGVLMGGYWAMLEELQGSLPTR